MDSRLCFASLATSECYGSRLFLLSELNFLSYSLPSKSVVSTQSRKSSSIRLFPGTKACPVGRGNFFFLVRRKARHRYRLHVKNTNFSQSEKGDSQEECSEPVNVPSAICNTVGFDHSEFSSGRVSSAVSKLGNREIDTGGYSRLFRIPLCKDLNDKDFVDDGNLTIKLLQKVLQGGKLVTLAIGLWFAISKGVQSTGRNPIFGNGAVVSPCSASTFHSTALEKVSESQSWDGEGWAEEMGADNLLIQTQNWDDYGENNRFKHRTPKLKPEGNSYGSIYDLEGSEVWESGSTGYLMHRDVNFAEMTRENVMTTEWQEESNLYMTETDDLGAIHKVEEEEDEKLENKFRKPWKLTVPLRIVSLRGSVPPLWLRVSFSKKMTETGRPDQEGNLVLFDGSQDFITSQGRNTKVTMKVQGDLGAIVSQLTSSLKEKKVNQESTMASDLVTIGDVWLEHAISSGVLSALKGSESSEWFQNLSPAWQVFLRRDEKGRLSPQGSIYAAPYRLGATVIAFRHDLFTKHNIPPIKKWEDLWHPRLVGRVAMVNSPREVVGATLKSLGAPYNVNSFDKDVRGGRIAVAERFKTLRKQVRLFDSTNHLKALKAGDVYVAVGWSNDILSFARRSSQVTVMTPEDGTSLWADLWVLGKETVSVYESKLMIKVFGCIQAVPATNKVKSNKIGGRIRGPSPLVSQWINFCLQPARAQSFQQEIFVGASPMEIPASSSLGIRTAGSKSGLTREENATTLERQIGINEVRRESLEFTPGSLQQELTSKVSEISDEKNLGEKSFTDEKKLGEKNRFFGGGISSLEVLSKSEMLQPLSESAVEDYRWLLTLDSRERGDLLYSKLKKFFKDKGSL